MMVVFALVAVWAVGSVFIWRWALAQDRAERDLRAVRELEDDFE